MNNSEMKSRLHTRLRALPGRLFVALVDATAILVIVAGLVTILAVNRLESAATTLAEGVFTNADGKQSNPIADLQTMAEEIRLLNLSLKQKNGANSEETRLQMGKLELQIADLGAAIDSLNQASSVLVEQAFREMGQTLADGLAALLNCETTDTENLSRADL